MGDAREGLTPENRTLAETVMPPGMLNWCERNGPELNRLLNAARAEGSPELEGGGNMGDEPTTALAPDGWEVNLAARASELANDTIYALFEELDDATYEQIGLKIYDAVISALEDHPPPLAELEAARAEVELWRSRAQDRDAEADKYSKRAWAAEEATEAAESQVLALKAEVERLKPTPNPHEHMFSVVYRSGPLTVADYDEAITGLQAAKCALQDGDSMGCRVCEDGGHGAESCHHNPLLLARKWGAASRFWQCWHCGYIATNDEEGRAHFGTNDSEPPSCIKAKLPPNEDGRQ